MKSITEFMIIYKLWITFFIQHSMLCMNDTPAAQTFWSHACSDVIPIQTSQYKEYMFYTSTCWTLHMLHIAVEYEDLSMQMFLNSNECFAKQKIFLNNFFITTRTHNTHFLQILTETVTYIYNYWPWK